MYMPTGKPITTELKQQVVLHYQSHPMTISNLAKDFGLSNPTIIKILDEYHIQRYKKAKIYNPELIENYFEDINSEFKAYYLGFIITDGNVFKDKSKSNRQASISITQNIQDEYILQKFLDEVKSKTSIGHDGRGCSRAAVRSNKMAEDLLKYGVCEQKTTSCYLPILDDKYMNHLIRGILDGDGNIKAHQTNVNNRFAHAISFCGTHKLMNDIGDYVSQRFHIIKPKVYDYDDRRLSEIKWQRKEDMYTIGEWLYGDATVFLRRKYDKYLCFKEHYGY